MVILSPVLNKNKQIKLTRTIHKNGMCGIIELPLLNLSNKQLSIKPKTLFATVDKLQDKHLPSLDKKTRTSMENKMIDSETCINFEVGDAVLTQSYDYFCIRIGIFWLLH